MSEPTDITVSQPEPDANPFAIAPYEVHKLRIESWVHLVFKAISLLLILPVLAVLIYLTYRAWPSLSFGFLWENPENGMKAGGIWAPLIGTFLLVFVSLIAAAPVGVLAGVYLNEYARDNWTTRLINLAVVNLAGVPSIVHGLFGVGAIALGRKLFGPAVKPCLLVASLTIAVMTLPVIIASTKEALAAVPMAFREACWNMGASRWQTVRSIVLPNSISGILTGVILQVSRAAGETAPILFTGAAYYMTFENGFGLGDKFMALSYHLFILSKQANDIPESMLYGTAVVLIGLVLLVNSVAIGARIYLRSRKKW